VGPSANGALGKGSGAGPSPSVHNTARAGACFQQSLTNLFLRETPAQQRAEGSGVQPASAHLFP